VRAWTDVLLAATLFGLNNRYLPPSLAAIVSFSTGGDFPLPVDFLQP
jgi:hypothetical protein